MASITHEIIDTVAILSRKGSWTTELNIICWNGGDPKFDIRAWNEEHTKCSKGVSLAEKEARALMRALQERLEKESC